MLSCFTYSLISMGITVWIAINRHDATWVAYAAIMTGHVWALAGLLWARGHEW